MHTCGCRLRHLGKLRRMLVQHDNSGANPAWHLFKVVVTCDKDKSVTTFVCNDWLRSAVSGAHMAGNITHVDTPVARPPSLGIRSAPQSSTGAFLSVDCLGRS